MNTISRKKEQISQLNTWAVWGVVRKFFIMEVYGVMSLVTIEI